MLAELDQRDMALWLSRGRAVIGLTCLFAPGVVARAWVKHSTPETRALVRVVGIRDLALAVGAITNVKEASQDAEWVSMGAISDGVDAAVSLATPGLPFRARLVGLFAAGAAVTAMKLSRDLADARVSG
jgi:hypothetical protein